MKRIGTITKLKPGMMAEYKKIHDEIWKDVMAAAHECGTRNYTIFAEGNYLFSYFEYVGNDYEADMKKKSEMPIMKKWKEATGIMLDKVDEEHGGCIVLTELFHCDF